MSTSPQPRSMPSGSGGVGGHMGKYLHYLVWSFMTLGLVVVACSIAVFVFSPEGIFIPVVGPYPGATKAKKKGGYHSL